MKKIVALLAGLFLAGVAVAQSPSLFITSPNGTESIVVKNTGPQITSIYLRQARDASGYAVSTASSGTVVMV